VDSINEKARTSDGTGLFVIYPLAVLLVWAASRPWEKIRKFDVGAGIRPHQHQIFGVNCGKAGAGFVLEIEIMLNLFGMWLHLEGIACMIP